MPVPRHYKKNPKSSRQRGPEKVRNVTWGRALRATRATGAQPKKPAFAFERQALWQVYVFTCTYQRHRNILKRYRRFSGLLMFFEKFRLPPIFSKVPFSWNINACAHYSRFSGLFTFSQILTFFRKLRLPPHLSNVPLFQNINVFPEIPTTTSFFKCPFFSILTWALLN